MKLTVSEMLSCNELHSTPNPLWWLILHIGADIQYEAKLAMGSEWYLTFHPQRFDQPCSHESAEKAEFPLIDHFSMFQTDFHRMPVHECLPFHSLFETNMKQSCLKCELVLDFKCRFYENCLTWNMWHDSKVESPTWATFSLYWQGWFRECHMAVVCHWKYAWDCIIASADGNDKGSDIFSVLLVRNSFVKS